MPKTFGTKQTININKIPYKQKPNISFIVKYGCIKILSKYNAELDNQQARLIYDHVTIKYELKLKLTNKR